MSAMDALLYLVQPTQRLEDVPIDLDDTLQFIVPRNNP